MKKVEAGGPGSGRHKSGLSGYKNQMFEIVPGIYRGHLPEDATPERRAAQEIEDRKTVEFHRALARNLERNINSPVAVD